MYGERRRGRLVAVSWKRLTPHVGPMLADIADWSPAHLPSAAATRCTTRMPRSCPWLCKTPLHSDSAMSASGEWAGRG